jgi:pimeloyl-[acyl-carrier protein] methyl ester esterase
MSPWMNDRATGLTVVLLPGLEGSGILFEPLLKHFPRDWHSIVVRYPGDRILGYDELLPLVRAELPLGQRFLLVGESFSGPLAIRLAAEQPAGLCGVVLIASFATTPAPWLPQWCQVGIRPWPLSWLRTASHLSARLMGFGTPELRRLFARAQSQVRPAVLAARVRATLSVNVLDELQRIAVPILYLAARRDTIISRSCQGHRQVGVDWLG